MPEEDKIETLIHPTLDQPPSAKDIKDDYHDSLFDFHHDLSNKKASVANMQEVLEFPEE